MTTNIFKEHIRAFMSERTGGHQGCKVCLVLTSGFALAARLTMISGNFGLLQYF